MGMQTAKARETYAKRYQNMFDLSPAEQLKGMQIVENSSQIVSSSHSQSIKSRNVESSAVIHLDIVEVPMVRD